MAWAQEIIDTIMKLKPWTTVNEYESGLYFWQGEVLIFRLSEKKLKWLLKRRADSKHGTRITLDEILQEEKAAADNYAKTSSLTPKQIEEGWRLKKGQPQHPEWYSINLPYGTYLHVPPILDISRVEIVPIKEVVKELKFISVLSKYADGDTLLIDGNGGNGFSLDKVGKPNILKVNETKKYMTHAAPLSISGLIRYEIEDGYKAYTQVTDWERSYQSQVLILLSKLARKMTINDWLDAKSVEKFTSETTEKLNTTGPVRKEWGIWTSEIGITDISLNGIQRYAQELYVPDEGLKLKIDNPKS